MAADGRPGSAGTSTKILDVAERLVQVRGFNGFSYADVAAELGITKASLHYHFATKADLGEALIERYTESFGTALAVIGASPTGALAKLDAYAALYAEVLRADRMCLCGMLAAEFQTLPARMRTAVIAFFDQNEAWLEQVLRQGQQSGTFGLDEPTAGAARIILSSLQGAMLIARSYGDAAQFESAANRLFALLGGGAAVR